jgi:hypothetical protein
VEEILRPSRTLQRWDFRGDTENEPPVDT